MAKAVAPCSPPARPQGLGGTRRPVPVPSGPVDSGDEERPSPRAVCEACCTPSTSEDCPWAAHSRPEEAKGHGHAGGWPASPGLLPVKFQAKPTRGNGGRAYSEQAPV